MAHHCAFCDQRIHSPGSLKCCLEEHEWTDEYEDVELHIGCPCPDHEFSGDFVHQDEI